MTRDVLSEQDYVRAARQPRTITARDREIFLKLITSDAQPGEALKLAAERYKKRRG